MASRMLKFVDVGQQMPDKRKAEARREDFYEIYRRFDPERAAVQAGRCSQCGIPFCQTHCPLQNNTQIGRASRRGRVCQYVKISVVAVTLKKKNMNIT